MKHNRCQATAGLLVAGTVLVSACSTSGPVQPYAKDVKVDCAGKQDLTASGSTAQANAMSRFVNTYQNACPGKALTYTANGSGAGIKEIFTGAITGWDDPAITALNGSMPAEDIHVVYRSDESGTTDNFQRYLQAASAGAWNRGTGKTFQGGAGQGATGNQGTSAMVKNTEGAISYNEWSFAMDQGLAAADIKTPAGIVHIGDDWVGKTIDGAKISAQGNDIVLDLSSIYSTTEKGVDPIILASYEMVCSKYPDPEVGKAVKGFLQSTVTIGQTDLNKSGYIPLPPDFQTKVSAAISTIT
jgi:phosphate transport system substrate-binding protein